jgi:hypothetical protein
MDVVFPFTNGNPVPSYTGCLADLTVNNELVDFASATVNDGRLEYGCPSRYDTSNDVDVSPVSFNLASSLIISSPPIRLQTISFQIKTRENFAPLLHLDNHTTIQVTTPTF